jgi:type II secretory pathway pseudopilin PulG
MLGKTNFIQKKLLKFVSKSSRSSEGITLLESLVAIIVLTIAVTVVTPPIFLAVATRVQNRKAEQAMNLAQKYVDRVQGIVEQGNYDLQSDNDGDDTGDDDRNEIPGQDDSSDNPRDIGAPTGLYDNQDGQVLDSPANCDNFVPFDTSDMPSAGQALRVDIDGDCEPDFFVQIFRSALEQVREDEVVAFPMGVRVYAWAAHNNFDGLCDPSADDNPDECPDDLQNRLEASLGPTQGFGDQRIQPLAVTYANIVYSEDASSLDWHRSLQD